jgi:elongation factor 1-gamma
LIAAEYSGVELNIPDFRLCEDNMTPEFQEKSPLRKVPVLETPQGSIFESNAIARYLARLRRDNGLYGENVFEGGLVDSWIDFSVQELELPASIWFYPVLGLLPANEEIIAKAKADLKQALLVLDNHLADKTYMVGHQITLADIVLVSALLYPFKFVMDADYRADIINVERWFMTCVHQPAFRAVVGEVVLCTEEMGAGSVSQGQQAQQGGKKNKKNKKKNKGGNQGEQQQQQEGGSKKNKKKKSKGGNQEAEEKKDEPAPEAAPVAKKVEHPLKIMDRENPSPFIGDTWKKVYSNCDTYDDAMNTFWDTFDAEGWSLWLCRYNYNAENTVLFMTSNLVSGFVQRSGEIRKWLFGVMQVTGQEAPHEVAGVWLIRGQSIQPLIDANDDAEYYTWTKIEAPVSDENKALVKAFWCNEDELEGKKIVDCKVFK